MQKAGPKKVTLVNRCPYKLEKDEQPKAGLAKKLSVQKSLLKS